MNDSARTKRFRKISALALAVLLPAASVLAGCRNTVPPLASSSTTGNELVKENTQPIQFWVATDTHYLDKALEDGGEAFQSYVTGGDGKILPYSDELAEALVYDVQQQKPGFLILSGDLTNNGEASSHRKLAEKLKRIEQLGTSVYVIPGNHDINNPWARSFQGDKQIIAEHITEQDFTRLYADFGFNEAVSRDQNSLSYLVKAAPGLWLLMIDSSQYGNNEKYGFPQTDGRILPATLSWIEDCAKLAASEHASIITVMHHNLLNHTSMSVSGFKLNNSQETMKQLRKNGLNLVLSGHIHMQDIRRDPSGSVDQSAEPAEMPVYDIATGAMAVNPHHYGAMTFDPDTRSVTYDTAAVDVEGWAAANQISDPNLLHFSSYAEENFERESFHKAMGNLSEADITETEKQAMAEAMAKLNVKYFAGTAASSLDEIKVMPGLQLWERMDGGFLSGYIRSMMEEHDQSNVSLQVVLTKP